MEVARVVTLLLLVFGFLERPWAHGVERGFAKIRWNQMASLKVDEKEKKSIESAIQESCSELLAETTEKMPARIKMVNELRENVYIVLLKFPGLALRRLGVQVERNSFGSLSGRIYRFSTVKNTETGSVTTEDLPDCGSDLE